MFLAQVLDKNTWVYDVTGLLQHCVAVLRLCHQLTDQLAAVPLQHASPQLSHMLCQATLRVMPRFDDLLSAVASPAVDIRVLEARATALATVCWALYLPFSLISQKYREAMGEPLQQMDHHLDALRQAAEIAERANLGKLELDWSHLDAVAENVAAQEAAKVITETTPLVGGECSPEIGDPSVEPKDLCDVLTLYFTTLTSAPSRGFRLVLPLRKPRFATLTTILSWAVRSRRVLFEAADGSPPLTPTVGPKSDEWRPRERAPLHARHSWGVIGSPSKKYLPSANLRIDSHVAATMIKHRRRGAA
ncbi:hypothetical protein Y032_0400g766 [Ancylostoma ceylanicum]|uniref:Transmembrane protein 98 n=2 Tax=Ancylostoma ceylanicum TaxID=53326 RepID=A0A016RQV9_9BILA|nr:hypothetical protein Y032_0400g766 [Ancylostoma ceylanicum]